MVVANPRRGDEDAGGQTFGLGYGVGLPTLAGAMRTHRTRSSPQ